MNITKLSYVYKGRPPKRCGVTNNFEFCRRIDKLAEHIREMMNKGVIEFINSNILTSDDIDPTKLIELGQGKWGVVYKLKLNNKDYALKVFTRHNDNNGHGFFNETKSAFACRQAKIWDVSKIKCSSSKARWILFEYIDKNKVQTKYDKNKDNQNKLTKYLRENKLIHTDFSEYSPYSNAIRCGKKRVIIDYGGIVKKNIYENNCYTIL
jgi:serine/threonine-protein kinase RIO1